MGRGEGDPHNGLHSWRGSTRRQPAARGEPFSPEPTRKKGWRVEVAPSPASGFATAGTRRRGGGDSGRNRNKIRLLLLHMPTCRRATSCCTNPERARARTEQRQHSTGTGTGQGESVHRLRTRCTFLASRSERRDRQQRERVSGRFACRLHVPRFPPTLHLHLYAGPW